MPARDSEAVVLRSYPYREADLIVSFFTRDRGKLRGVARGVRRPKNKFGVALERLAVSRLHYRQKEQAELVTVERAELAGPSNLWKASYSASVVLDLIAETADQVLPPEEPHDAYFRLLRLVVEECCRGVATPETSDAIPVWAHRSLAYFLIWAARLGGWLPPLDRCEATQRPFKEGEPVYFSPHREGLFHADLRDGESWLFPPEARALANAMLSKRLDSLEDDAWPTPAAFELQRFLLQRTQAQIEVRLRGADALRAMWRDETLDRPSN